ncbi:MAG: hypothetical protein ABI910_02975 [Gemmatimonadota bacterium]
MTAGREWLGRRVAAAVEGARRFRPGTRDVARQYAEGLRFRAASRHWSASQREAAVLRQLQVVVRRAAARTPFYAARLRAAGFDPSRELTFADFAHLPILERADVAEHGPAMVCPDVPPAQRKRDGTGGSTGAPLQYWSGPEERAWRLSGQDFFMESLGVGRGASIAFLWGHHIDSRERTQWRERLRDVVTNRRWYDCFRISPSVFLDYHRQMHAFAPSAIVAYASALDGMAGALLDHSIRATYPTRRVITGAEKLWSAQRARVEAAFAAPVHERYGSRDVGFIAGQYEGSAGAPLLVDWANLLIEPETDDPESAILVTKLHADAMPMIRYRVGDVARFPAGSRPGHPVWELPEVVGRQLDGLHLPDGRWVHGVGIPHLMKEQPLHEFQIRQNEDYSIDVLIVPNERYAPAAGDDILRVLRENLPGVPLRLQLVDAIERTQANKWRPVITHVKRATAPVATKESA